MFTSRGELVTRPVSPVVLVRGFVAAAGPYRWHPSVLRLAEAVKWRVEDLSCGAPRARTLDFIATQLQKQHERNVAARSGKRAFDLLGAMAGLLVAAPLMMAVFLLVRLTSPGPAVFSQMRVGEGGRPFKMYKFRSMFVDRGNASGVLQTCRGDPRVTPLGRVLRQCNLDELPQLFNVLKGDMSLVGPRPHPIGMQANGKPYEQLAPVYSLRHLVKPGITGLAQARGYRGRTVRRIPALMRLVCDLTYIANYSVWFDIKIVWKTLVRELCSGGSGD
jgi:lipopolysaccharide/colanic/teichoic acid biosynthesis glycosyltransferase